MSAIDFNKLNFQLGVLLYNAQTTKNIEVLKDLTQTLSGRYIYEKMKEGYMSSYLSYRNISDAEKERSFCEKVDLLQLTRAFSIPTTTTGESLYNYIGNEVLVNSIFTIKSVIRFKDRKQTLKSIVFNPEKCEYEIVLLDKSLRVFNEFLCYYSSLKITPLTNND